MVTAKTEQTLIEKLVKVASDIRYIEKGGKNTAQNYKFVGEAQVVEKVGPALLALGVLAYPRHRMLGEPIQFTTKSGSVQFLTTIESTWVFTDGASDIEVVTIGQGTDSGDKGVYKAMTGAKKYGLLQALMIATGDDPEETRDDEREERSAARPRAATKKSAPSSDDEDDEPKITDRQLVRLMTMGRNAGMDKAGIQAFVKKETGRYKSKEITQAEVQRLFELLDVMIAADGAEVVDKPVVTA